MHLYDALLAGRRRTPSRRDAVEMVPAGRDCVPPRQKPVHLHVAPLARERCSPFTGSRPCTVTRAGDRSPPRPEREEARCTCTGRLRPGIVWLGCHSCGACSDALQREDRPQWRRRLGWMAGTGVGHDGEREGRLRRLLQPAQEEVHAPVRAACRRGWSGLAAIRAGRAAMPCNVSRDRDVGARRPRQDRCPTRPPGQVPGGMPWSALRGPSPRRAGEVTGRCRQPGHQRMHLYGPFAARDGRVCLPFARGAQQCHAT